MANTGQSKGGPVANKNLANYFSSPVALGFWSIVLGLLVPPVGLVLATVAIYRAGQSSKKVAMILGLLGIAAAIGGGVFYNLVYHDHQKNALNENVYSYNALEDYRMSGSQNKNGMIFRKPSSFTPQVGFSDSNSQAHLVQRVKLAGYINPVTVASIDTQVGIPFISVKTLNDMFSVKGQSGDGYKGFKNSLIAYLGQYVAPRTALSLGAPQPFTNTFIKGDAWKYDFTADSTNADGTPRHAQGQLLIAITNKAMYYFSVVAIGKNWPANINTWNQIFSSVNVDQ